MSSSVSGEQHERAVEAMAAFLQSEWAGPYMARIRDFSPAEISMGKLADADTEAENQARAVVRRALDAYHHSLAEQGIRLVEQPKCPACDGSGCIGVEHPEYDLDDCARCNGTGYVGYVRLVDLCAAVEWLRAGGFHDGTYHGDAADALERRFGSVSDG